MCRWLIVLNWIPVNSFWSLLATLIAPAWMASVCGSARFAKVFPHEAWFTRLIFLVWSSVVIASWYCLPVLLPWLLLLAVGTWTVIFCCDLRGQRAARGTPPGRLSILAGVRALADRDYYLRNFERYGPVFKMSQYGAPTICVLGQERIEKLIKGHSGFLGPSTLPISNSVEGTFLRYMPKVTHAFYGRLFRRAMSMSFEPSQVRQVDRICESHLASLAEHKSSPYPELQSLARRSLNHLLLGLGAETPEGQRFDELARGFAKAGIGRSLVHRDRQVFAELRRILAEKVEMDAADIARDADAADGTSVLVRLRQLDPAMPDRVCLDNLIVMHRIATGNVSSLLVWLLYRWATEDTIVSEIRAEPSDTRESLLALFLAETLRTSQSEYLYRRVVKEFDFEGYRYPSGWLVRGCVWESHSRTDAIDDPARFQLRRGDADYDRRHFIPLGVGSHACNGGGVNELICLAFLKQLLCAADVRVTCAEPLQRQMRHWSHWQPNYAMRVNCGGIA